MMCDLHESMLPSDWTDYSIADMASLAPIQILDWPLLNEKGIQVAVKREDKLSSELSGNKFYKLYGHIKHFQVSGFSAIASFGGAYSNHIYSLAAAGRLLNIPTIGVIRGERANTLSPTLVDAEAMGMKLVFVTRSEYKKKSDIFWLKHFEQHLQKSIYWVPEGGGDRVGAEGCVHWGRRAIDLSPWVPTHLCVAAGTGGTAAGILAGSNQIPVHAFLAIKGKSQEMDLFTDNVITMARSLRGELFDIPSALPSFHLETDFHCGGYARLPSFLKEFMLDLEMQLNLPLDPVYTAKLFWGIAKKAEANEWPENSRLLVFHTGGLQGRRGYPL